MNFFLIHTDLSMYTVYGKLKIDKEQYYK